MFAAAFQVPVWYIYLFVATPTGQPVTEAARRQLVFTFSGEGPYRWWFVWFAAMPVLALLVGLAYLAKGASRRVGAIALVCVSSANALGALALADWTTALVLAMPIYFGAQCVRGT